MTTNNSNLQTLENLIQTCVTKAQWHYQQYTVMRYYQQYYSWLLHCQKNYGQTTTCRDMHNKTHHDRVGEVVRENKIEDHGSSGGFKPEQQRYYHQSQQQQQGHKKKKKKKCKKFKETKTSHDNHNSTMETETESELELNEGFKEFLKQSEKFRRERDALKLKPSTTKNEDVTEITDDIDVEYVDILHKGPDGTTLPPTASNRKQLYEEKYGQSGTKILSLETALQWKHNKFIDQYTPTMWPAMPIRFT